MNITLDKFLGENRAKNPLNLPDGVGTVSLNQNPVRGGLRPWRAPVTVATIPNARQTIYRMGRDVASDANYWLSWPSVVHVVRASEADDTTERTYFTGDGVPKWTDNTRALGAPPYPVASRLLGVPAPMASLLLTASGGVATTMETRYYTYTYVNDVGHEGAQAPVSLELICKTDASVTINGIQAPPAGAYFINRVRIYRTQSGQTGDTEFFFVRELALGASSTTDDGRQRQEVLTTSNYLMPPADLRNLTGMWNGMLAGISGNSMRVCAAYKYYAWPIAFEVIPPDAKPVALAKFGEQSMLLLTTGNPMLITGSTPDALDAAPLAINEACIAGRSVVEFGHGVVWACPDGLAYYGSGRAAGIITNGILTKDDWQALNPASIVASAYEGAYMGLYTVQGVTKGFFIDPLNPTGLYFHDIPASAVYFDEIQDQLYILQGTDIKRWDAGAPLVVSFKSKTFRAPKRTSFACAKVVADSFPVQATFHAVNITPAEVAALTLENPALTAPTPTSVAYTVSVTSDEAFYLPPITQSQWQIALSTSGDVQGIPMAESMAELSKL